MLVVCVGVPERLGVFEGVTVLLGVPLCEAVNVVVGVPVGDEPVVEDGVGVGVLVAVIEPVRLIVCDGVCVGDCVFVALKLPVLDGVLEPVPERVIVPVLDIVPVGVVDLVPVCEGVLDLEGV